MSEDKNPEVVPQVLKTWFVVHFVIDMLFAIPLMAAPVFTLELFGWSHVESIATRLVAAALFGIGIESYLGLVSGEAILGANIFKDLFASVRDVIGGRSASYERELRKAKDIALEEMKAEAQRLGGNAVIAVDLDYETIGGGGGNMLMVSASGTAVKIIE